MGRKKRVWVSEGFAKLLKKEAVNKDTTILKLTEDIARTPALYEDLKNEKKEKRPSLKFRF